MAREGLDYFVAVLEELVSVYEDIAYGTWALLQSRHLRGWYNQCGHQCVDVVFVVIGENLCLRSCCQISYRYAFDFGVKW